MYGYIYKTTYLGDKRIYVGQKKGNFKPSYLGSGKHLRLAISKYGKHNFWVELLAYADTADKLNDLEKYYIQLYRNALGSDKLFNLANGGITERALSGEANGMYGVHRWGEKSPYYKDGRTLVIKHCLDCGKKISYNSKRCRVCCNKENKKIDNYVKSRDADYFRNMALARGKPWNAGLTKENNSIMAQAANKMRGRKVWNTGLTKHTDERIAAYGIKISKTKLVEVL
jgi:hypothetical protein